MDIKNFLHYWDSQAVEQVGREAVLSSSLEAVKTSLKS